MKKSNITQHFRNRQKNALKRLEMVKQQIAPKLGGDSKDNKTIINVYCPDRGDNQGCFNSCPVYDSLGYPYYPYPMVGWATPSPLAFVPSNYFLPSPPPFQPPCSVNIPFQGYPSSCQFPQLFPSFASNFNKI